MEEIATLLRQARESKGISLEEVKTATRIPMYYLEVLEGGRDTRFLADRLYLIPFLRNYATFLGVNPGTAVAQFITEWQRVEASAVHSERVHEPFRFSPLIVLLLLLVALLVTLSFVWHSGGIDSLWQWTKEEPPSSSLSSGPSTELRTGLPSSPETAAEPPVLSSPPSSLSSDLPSSSPETSVESSVPPSPPPSSPAEAGAREIIPAPIEASPTALATPKPEQPSTEAPHLLRIRARERAWVRATIDGEQEKDVLLQPGEEVEWSARERFILTLGNAGGVNLTFNGKDLPSLGVSGQVIRDLRLPSPEEGERE